MTELSAGTGGYSGTALDSHGILHVGVQQAFVASGSILLQAASSCALPSQQPTRVIEKEALAMIASSNPECQLRHLCSPCKAM